MSIEPRSMPELASAAPETADSPDLADEDVDGERGLWVRCEDRLAVLLLAGAVSLPLIEILGRRLFGQGIPGSIDYVRHLTLWIGFLGAALASREGRHLALTLVSFVGGRVETVSKVLASSLAAVVCVLLGWASLEMVVAERESVSLLGGWIPLWAAQLIMPAGFFAMAVRFFRRAPGRAAQVTALLLVAGAAALALLPYETREGLRLPGIALMLLGAGLGAPIFVALGGLAVVLLYTDGVTLAAVPVEAYGMASNYVLPSIPLFTLAGAVLAEGKAPARLIRLFQALFGSIPGGTAIAAVTVCAFFTTFTGGSGVTILALGGLLLPVLTAQGYSGRFSLGILTASGSIGILFPPSLVIILYGIASHTPINQLFAAGILPGLVLVSMVAAYAIWKGRSQKEALPPFRLRECAAALWNAKWEAALPVIVLLVIFSGYATLVEASALAAFYVIFTEGIIHRDLRWRGDFPRIFKESTLMVGGIIIILASAMGLTNYLIFADVPTLAADWVQSGIVSRWIFLLALVGFLLLVGCLMDIYSAIVVVAPLVAPVAVGYGIDPVHLGILFLATMELGYLTPPVGLNLFVAAFRFKRPVLEIYRACIPFFFIMLLGVMLVALVPRLSLFLVR